MPVIFRSRLLIFSGLIFILAILACKAPFSWVAEPQKTEIVPTVPGNLKPAPLISPTESTDSSNKALFSYKVSEEQLTEQVTASLNTQSTLEVQDPQVYLTNGQIEFTGKINQSGFNFPLTIKINLSIDQDKQLEVNIISANVGPLSLPDNVLDQISTQIDQSLNTALGLGTTPVAIDQIIIQNGVLEVQGHYP